MAREQPLDKLRGLIREQRLSYVGIAGRLGVSIGTLSHKLNGKTEFSIGEAFDLAEILGIPADGIQDYFYPRGKGETENDE